MKNILVSALLSTSLLFGFGATALAGGDYKQTIRLNVEVTGASYPQMICDLVGFETTDAFDGTHWAESSCEATNSYDHGPKNWHLNDRYYDYGIVREQTCSGYFDEYQHRTPDADGTLDIYVTADYGDTAEVTLKNCWSQWSPA